MTADGDTLALFQRELTTRALAGEWDTLAFDHWRRLAELAVAADRVPELLGAVAETRCHGPARILCHNALVAAGPAGHRWAGLLRAADLVLQPRRGAQPAAIELARFTGLLWSTAAGLGWAGEEVERLRRLTDPNGSHLRLAISWPLPPPQPDHVLLAGDTAGSSLVSGVTLPDGRVYVATANADRYRLFDIESGMLVATGDAGHDGPITTMCPVRLPDGRVLLATGGQDATVRLWDPLAGRQAGGPLLGHQAPVRAICAVTFRDGQVLLVTGGDDATVRRWNPETGQAVGEPMEGHTGQVRAACPVPMPDGTVLLATGGGGETVRVWEPITGAWLRSLSGDGPQPVGFLYPLPGPPGGTVLLTCAPKDVPRFWDPGTGARLPNPWNGLQPVDDPASRLCVVPGPHGRVLLAVGGRAGIGPEAENTLRGRVPSRRGHVADAAVSLWDAESGNLVATGAAVATRDTRLSAVPLPGGGALLVGCDPETQVWLWNIDAALNPATGPSAVPAGPAGPVWPVRPADWPAELSSLCVVACPGRPALICTVDGWFLRSYDAETWEQVGEPLYAYQAIGLIPVDNLDASVSVAGYGSDHLYVWNPWTAETEYSNADALVQDPNGLCQLGRGTEGEFDWWLFATDAPSGVRVLRECDRWTEEVVAYPDGGYDYAEWTGVLCALPLADGRQLLAHGPGDGTIRLWHTDRPELAGAPLRGHAGAVTTLGRLTLPDRRVELVSGGVDGTVRRWDPVTATAVGEPLTGHRTKVVTLCQLDGPHGRVLLASADNSGEIRIWDVPAGRTVAVLHVGRSFTKLWPLPGGGIALESNNRPFTARIVG